MGNWVQMFWNWWNGRILYLFQWWCTWQRTCKGWPWRFWQFSCSVSARTVCQPRGQSDNGNRNYHVLSKSKCLFNQMYGQCHKQGKYIEVLGQLKRLTCDSPLWFATFGGYLTSLEGVELDMDWWQRILSLRNYLFSPFIASILVLCSSGIKTIWLIVCKTAEFIFVKILFSVKFQLQLFRSFSNSVVIQRKLQIKYQNQLCHR